MSAEAFKQFFADATGGLIPYDWQIAVATNGLPDVLPIPTGLGKTEGVVLGWVWRRFKAGVDEPLHLVYCLPMRTLVRQTVQRLRRYFDALARTNHLPSTSVYQLMGGAIDDEWARRPDQPWVLVGTQDQLLSRALNRGYSMSRFEWPVHFGLLNQDCRWIVDEVQLMGPGLWTTAQLDWMRQKRFFSLKRCRTTWMSATIGTGFLSTTDRIKDGLDEVASLDPRLDDDKNSELQRRRSAWRQVEWLAKSKAKNSGALAETIATCAQGQHKEGTLSLIICNTVRMAQDTFRALSGKVPKILLTSRFRPSDRRSSEEQLLDFEERRSKHTSGRIEGDPGLMCVSTQVIEAGLDVSAHHMWTELAPWPSMIQRLGRLNRDGRYDDARVHVWTSKGKDRKHEGEAWVGPYRKRDIDNSAKLIDAVIKPAGELPFSKALQELNKSHEKLLASVLEPRLTPLPRAFDVHGLFSTERDVHGGFTDVSEFVRGSDPDADVSIFWREWAGAAPPRGDDLDGPWFDPEREACAVAFYRVEKFLKANRSKSWIWDDETEQWASIPRHAIRPGMVVMLRRDTGGYDSNLGWTGESGNVLDEVPRAGKGRALRDDERTEIGYWSQLPVHLSDARAEAEQICDAVGLRAEDVSLRGFRLAVVEGAGLHDLGKAHPKWQTALPAGVAIGGAPWAKCPPVLAIDTRSDDGHVAEAVERIRPAALRLPNEPRQKKIVRLRWAVGEKLKRHELDELKKLSGVWAGHVPLRSGMRHEAASALAMWNRYHEGRAGYPALAVYLAAAHHGKVRTVFRSTVLDGDDVFGVGRAPDAIELGGERWAFDFSVAADGAAGEWQDDKFVLTGYGWTGVVADLLGPWRGDDDSSEVGAVPANEPRRLGPFVLAWLEALVRVADWRASESPSHSIKPEAVSRA